MTGPADGTARDPGLQPERTRLAWRRTTLACTVVAALAVRQAVRGPATPLHLSAVALTALLWLAFLRTAHHRIADLAAPRPPGLAPRSALGAALFTVALAGMAVALLV
ncbi:DUF202 domain-containing protein [Streptomyces bambusae]|uniref:DUF202 domain-containing protein n=1 Tax=Streptomyces bambusae TaxID=1550616 RepID=UPI001CFFBDF1|nr:DUF202 domain-containing protein [Streptomyces bambusae]MCB5169724.1 DUF202 domain-containing protein [Streptomyces bambusae]